MALALNKENLLKGLLQYNYFPRTHDQKEEMPPIFSSTLFTPEVAAKILAVELSKQRRKSGYDIMPFRRTRHPNIPRIMGIPHPRAYVQLVASLTDNWEAYIKDRCQSENSNLTFEVQEDFRIIVHNYDRTVVDGEVESQDHSLDFGMKYRAKTDITNFYHSIYSHSLPWALVGHNTAKKERDNALWFNQIDASTRFCQRNETKGIAIGPATSSLLSEIILFQVDKALREKYKFSRYIDDYTAFVESRAKADAFLVDLAKELEKYALSLNPKKTTILEMPVLNKEKWVTEINLLFGLDEPQKSEGGEILRKKVGLRQLRLLIDKAISLGMEYPDGSVIKYAFSSILEAGVDGSEAERYLQDALLKYAYHFSALIPLIHRWLSHYPLSFEIDERIQKLFRHSIEQGQTDNTAWCIFYIIRSSAVAHKELLEECCRDETPMVMLMGYVYAKKTGLDVTPIVKWATGKIQDLKSGNIEEYDIDRFWLVFYQLYFDGVITSPPYREAEDNKIFNILKQEKVSFIDYQHEDLKSRAEIIFGPVRDKLSALKKAKGTA